MSEWVVRAYRLGALGLLLASLAGCSDSTTDNCKESSDCALGSTCEAGQCVPVIVECFDNEDCSAGQVCEGQICVDGCRSNAECGANAACINNRCQTQAQSCNVTPDCPAGSQCITGRCVATVQCSAVGDSCTPGARVRDGFACADIGEGNKCYLECEQQRVCAVSGALNTRNVCPLGSLCQPSGTRNVCQPSNCDPGNLNADCEALAAENPGVFPNGAICQRRQVLLTNDGDSFLTDEDMNYTYRCVAPGSGQRGGACGAQGGGIGGGGRVECGRGLKCMTDEYIFGVFTQGQFICQQPCLIDSDCSNGESCIGGRDRRYDGAGICGVRCEPGDLDPEGCPSGNSCLPVTATDGLCVATNTNNALEPFADCSGGGANCTSGTVCVAGQCLPMCDPTRRNQPERDATCLGGDPDAFLRVLHLAPSAGEVDVYINNQRVIDDLAFDQLAAGERGWFTLKPGTYTVDVVAGAAENNNLPLLRTTLDLVANTSTNVLALPQDGPSLVRLLPVQDVRFVAEPAANRTQLRFVHAVVGVGDVDVIATAPDADVSEMANRTVLASGLSYGAATSYAARNSGRFDVYVFPAGGPYTELDALTVFQDTNLAQGQRASVIVHGDVTAAAPVVPALRVLPHRIFRHIPTSTSYCYDLAGPNGAVTAPGWGICLQRCEGGANDYGDRSCDAPVACQPFGTNISVCLASIGPAQVGEDCSISDCADGLFCDEGTESSVCRSYCTLDGVENPNLPGCQAGEVCQPSALIPKLGECRLACQPESPSNFRDLTRCPVGQQSCYPEDGEFSCKPSGMLARGADCKIVQGNSVSRSRACEPGTLCVREMAFVEFGLEQLIEAFVNLNSRDKAACRSVCRPFKARGEPSDCPSGEACMPILPSQDLNTAAGICFPVAQGVTPDFEECNGDSAGKMCRDGSMCQRNLREPPPGEGNMCSQDGSCLQFCDYATQRGCLPGQRCVVNGGVGNRQLIFGVYGICTDET